MTPNVLHYTFARRSLPFRPRMRRDLNRPHIALGIQIPAEDFDLLSTLLPMKGAKTWAIEAGISSFLNLMEASPRLCRWAYAQTQKMLNEDGRVGPTRELNAKLPTDLYVRFSKVLPDHGGMTWFIRRYIQFLVETLQDGASLEMQVEATVSRAMAPEAESFDEREIVHQGPDQ